MGRKKLVIIGYFEVFKFRDAITEEKAFWQSRCCGPRGAPVNIGCSLFDSYSRA